MQPDPETYYLRPTQFVPNSKLPVLLYRGVLGDSPSPESIRSLIEPNKWIRGGQWKTYPTAHFHSVSHECYAIFRGKSTFRLGKSPIDPEASEEGEQLGRDVVLERGDIIVLPVSSRPLRGLNFNGRRTIFPLYGAYIIIQAGVSHHSINSEGDFEYVGLYPEVCYQLQSTSVIMAPRRLIEPGESTLG